MFDFVRDIIADDDAWGIERVMNEMKGLVNECEERLEELRNEKEND